MPFANVLYFADFKWWELQRNKQVFRDFSGEKCTIFVTGNMVDDPAVHMLRKAEGDVALSDDPDAIATFSNSGHQALNIAYLTAPRRIILVGYDAMPGDGRKVHFFGNHPDNSAPPYRTMINGMNAAAPLLRAKGIDVVNSSPRSAIEAFRKAPLDDALLT